MVTSNALVRDLFGKGKENTGKIQIILIILLFSSIGFATPQIDFVMPTPNNNSAINTNYAFINISSNENLSSCTLFESTAGIYGNGRNGSLTVTSANTVVNTYASLSSNALAGDTSIALSSSTGFSIGDEVLIIQMQNSSSGTAGTYEFKTVSATSTGNLSFTSGLSNSYYTGTFNTTSSTATQVVRVPNYVSVTVNSGASIVATAWNGSIGGIVVFRSLSSTTVSVSISTAGMGFRG